MTDRSEAGLPVLRTFSLNSEDFYRAVTPPPDPWRWGPGLPSEPRRVRDREVIVEVIDNRAPIVNHG